MATKSPYNLLKAIVDELYAMSKKIASVLSILAVVFSPVVYAAGEIVQPYLELPQTVQTLKDQTAQNFDVIGRRLNAVERNISDLTPPEKIAEWDVRRTKVLGDCVAGSACRAQFLVKRTEHGKSCGTPTATYFVSNHNGIQYPVLVDFEPIRVGTLWTQIEFSFNPPDNAQPGQALLFIDLEYPNCNHMAVGLKDRERSIEVPFQLLANS